MFEKIKDYFSFSRKERIAVLILVFLIIVILLLPYLFPKPTGNFRSDELKNLAIRLSDLQVKTTQQASVKERFSKARDYKLNDKSYSFQEDKLPRKAALFYFDPNKLSGEDWKRLGLREKTIQTIHNYISKGGKFKNKEDIQKIYGLHPNDVERLMPYVRIEKVANFLKKENYVLPPLSESHTQPGLLHPLHAVDINQADTTEWIALPGIGSKLATRIVHFREKLGGFHSVNQLSEIYGLPDSTFQKIRPGLTTGNSVITLINVNTAGINELKQHPYIKWNIASAIIEYRKQHGNFTSIEDLMNIDLVTNEIYKKIVPYLDIK